MTRSHVGAILVAVWAPAILAAVALLMVDHIVPLPAPGDPAAVASGVRARLGAALEPDGWRAAHVIYEGCSCTDRLFAHLLERGPLPDWSEGIVYVGDDARRLAEARRRGFHVAALSRAALRRELALDAAPVLVLLDPRGSLAYLGGYFEAPAAVRPRDASIQARVHKGELPTGLPVFGCAVDDALARRRDPLGFRQWK